MAIFFTKTSAFIVQVEKNFADIQLESVDMYSDEWVAELESLQNIIDTISVSTKMM